MEELSIQLPKELQTKVASKLLGRALIEFLKREIFNRYKQNGDLTDEDWEFCEQIDWHPVDELPIKKEHSEELKRRLKEVSGKKYTSAEEFFSSLK